ncbi:MAG: C40 family peptidase [Lachnospiraceae bacterium]|nr:C40 family peptidase [Lachnospiraceae bacterium]
MEKKKTKHLRFSQEDLKEKGFRETAVRRTAKEETKSSGRKLIYDRWSGRVIQQRFGRKNQWKSVLDTPEYANTGDESRGNDIASDTFDLMDDTALYASKKIKNGMYSRKIEEMTEEEYQARKAKKSKLVKLETPDKELKSEDDVPNDMLMKMSKLFQKKGIKAKLQAQATQSSNGDMDIAGPDINPAGAGGGAAGGVEGAVAEGGTAVVETTGEAVVAGTEVAAAESSPVLMIILVVIIVLLLVVGIGIVLMAMLPLATTGTVTTTSYTAKDGDIVQTDKDYRKLEKDLQEKVGRIARDHPGYDEYRYDLAEIGHNPYELAALLTVKLEDYTRAEAQALIRQIFAAQYKLTLREVNETRYRDKKDSSGNPIKNPDGSTQKESYTWHVLVVKLENRGIDGAADEIGLDAQERERYEILKSTKGNRDYLFDEDVYVPGNDTDPGEDGYHVPGEAMTDEQVAALITEAKKYLGMEYVWGESSPSTGFDCSGYVCWCINHSGFGNVGRTSAKGLLAKCSRISPSEAKPGDLVFFEKTYATNGASHVGIYLGGNMMIHCGNVRPEGRK